MLPATLPLYPVCALPSLNLSLPSLTLLFPPFLPVSSQSDPTPTAGVSSVLSPDNPTTSRSSALSSVLYPYAIQEGDPVMNQPFLPPVHPHYRCNIDEDLSKGILFLEDSLEKYRALIGPEDYNAHKCE